jgi:hypothetical protein
VAGEGSEQGDPQGDEEVAGEQEQAAPFFGLTERHKK